MPGRRALDKLVGERIFKLTIREKKGDFWLVIDNKNEPILPYYSVNIGAAWKIVEFIGKQGYPWPFKEVFERAQESYDEETVAFEICIAGLKAVGVPV